MTPAAFLFPSHPTWPVFLAVVWGAATACVWSHAARPARLALVRWLRLVEAALPFGGEEAWLSRGPCCPACVAFWAGLAMWALGGAPLHAGAPEAALGAYGVVLVLAALTERVAPEGF